MNSSNMPLPNVIYGVTGSVNIVDMWKSHYNDLFNCLRNNKDVKQLHTDVHYDANIEVSHSEIFSAINDLANNKSCGLDGVNAEHLKHCSDRIVPMLAICFTGLFIHGVLPPSMISVVLVPIVKNKRISICSKNNYRPITLTSIMSKLLEKIIYECVSEALETCSNQFGFKAKHSTDMCILAFKEAILKYRDLSSNVYTCFLDASKAFDRVNHFKLFTTLSKRNVPMYIIRILIFWYTSQTMYVRWNNTMSTGFNVSNGVRQGGILSPYLFCIDVDDLSKMLNNVHVGCFVGTMLVNHLMYADDLVLLSPSAAGLSILLSICSTYGIEYDVMYNSTKSNVLVFRSKLLKNVQVPEFEINNTAIDRVSMYKYLGHCINDELSDDDDMTRQRNKIYAQGNALIRKFYMCTENVKIALFKPYCTTLYTSTLWCKYRRESLRKLCVAYRAIPW